LFRATLAVEEGRWGDIMTCPRSTGCFAADQVSERNGSRCADLSGASLGIRPPASVQAQVRPGGFVRLVCGLMTLGILVIVLLALLPAEDQGTKKIWVFSQLLTIAVLDVIVVATLVPSLTRWCFEGKGPPSIGAAVLYLLCVLVFIGAVVVVSGIICLALMSPLW
jgi:hypothetical protein